MKNIRLILNFYSQNKLPAVIMFVTYTLALMIVVLSVGEYRYITYSRDQFINLANKELLYCMPQMNYGKMMELEGDSQRVFIQQMEDEAAKYKAYQPFSTISHINLVYNGQFEKGYLYSEQLLATQRVNLAEGNWFAQYDANADYFDVILSGQRYADKQLGEVFEVSILTDSLQEYPIRVRAVGRLSPPNMLPSFSMSGSNITANNLYESFYGLVFMENDRLLKTLDQSKTHTSTYSSFMATMDPSATAAEKEAYLEFLKAQGIVATYDEILENTAPVVEEKLRRTLPTPIFFLVIVTIACVSVAVLFVHKKLGEYAIYYLCGCSRGKTYMYMLLGIGLISAVGAGLNMLLCISYPMLASLGILSLGNVLLDNWSLTFIALYAAFTILLSVSIPFITFRKNTPIEVYRRFES